MTGVLNVFDVSRFLSSSGNAEGATIYFYATGTSNLAPIYTDSTLTTQLGNPLTVATGAIVPAIFLDPAVTYRRRIVFSSDSSVHDEDPLPVINTQLQTNLSSSTGAGLVGTTQGITVQANLNLKAPLASPTFTGTPAAPTVTAGDSSTKIASTAFVTTGIATSATATLSSAATAATNYTNSSITSAELETISASVASNALTVGFTPNPGLAFRSATLTSGTLSTWTSSTPLSLVVPSGATLGMTNAVAAQLILLVLYNAGTPVLGIVNRSTAISLDEMGVISSTAITAASDSAGVVYTTNAITNSPYRVVGLLGATEATVGTWATAPSLVQGMGGEALTALQGAGMGQSWSNAGKSLGTTYYNNTHKPIQVNILAQTTSGSARITATVNGYSFSSIHETLNECQLAFTVPPGQSYSVAMSTGTATVTWSELS